MKAHTVGIDIHFSAAGEKQLEDFERPWFSTVVQSRVAFDALSVDIGTEFDEVASDF